MADSSKTEKASPKKRQDERKKGHVPMSKDTVAVATLFTSILMLRLGFRSLVENVAAFLAYCLNLAGGRVVAGMSDNILLQMTGVVARSAGPMLLATAVAAIAATMAQTRLLVTAEPLKPKLSKLNPIEGFKKLFSLKSVIQAGMSMLKIILLLVVIYYSLRDLIEIAARYLYADITGSCTHMLQAIFSMLLRVGLGFLVLAAVDFMYQRWDFEREMRMSKQEVKEEYKQTEGDPQIKGRIKQLQRQMAQSRMMQKVPGADVVVRNPTHIAVALRYHSDVDSAPVVLAMGADYLAGKIVEVAEAHDITIVENVPLARALYARAELDKAIPPDLYEAVAEVMVYLYKLGRIQA